MIFREHDRRSVSETTAIEGEKTMNRSHTYRRDRLGRFSRRSSPGRLLAAMLAAVRPLPKESRTSGTVLVDESGDLGRGPGSNRTFTMTATVTGDPDEFAAIAGRYPRNTRYGGEGPDELKYNSSSDGVRRSVLRDVMATDPSIHAVVTSKTDSEAMSRENVYTKTTRTLMDSVMQDPRIRNSLGTVRVVYDNHKCLYKGNAQRITSEAAAAAGLERVPETRLADSARYAPLQAHDFVAGAVGARYNRQDSGCYDIIASRTKTVRKDLKR